MEIIAGFPGIGKSYKTCKIKFRKKSIPWEWLEVQPKKNLYTYCTKCLKLERKRRHKEFQERLGCHSFWYRECVNRGKECYHCSQHYGIKNGKKFYGRTKVGGDYHT